MLQGMHNNPKVSGVIFSELFQEVVPRLVTLADGERFIYEVDVCQYVSLSRQAVLCFEEEADINSPWQVQTS